MNTYIQAYIIRITTKDNLFADYIVSANDLFSAKSKAKKAFFRDYPDADKKIKLSLEKPDTKKITEILNIIKEAI